MNFHVYIIGTVHRDVFTTGVTNNIAHCLSEYRLKRIGTASLPKTPERLVYFETYDRMEQALSREAAIKNKGRDLTVALVENLNPDWDDLYQSLHV